MDPKSLDDVLQDDELLEFMLVLGKKGYGAFFYYMRDDKTLSRNQILERTKPDEADFIKDILNQIMRLKRKDTKRGGEKEETKGGIEEEIKENKYFTFSDGLFTLTELGIGFRERIKRLGIYENLPYFNACFPVQGAPQTQKKSANTRLRILLYIVEHPRVAVDLIVKRFDITTYSVDSYLRILDGTRSVFLKKTPFVSYEEDDRTKYVSPTKELTRFVDEILKPVLEDFGYRC